MSSGRGEEEGGGGARSGACGTEPAPLEKGDTRRRAVYFIY